MILQANKEFMENLSLQYKNYPHMDCEKGLVSQEIVFLRQFRTKIQKLISFLWTNVLMFVERKRGRH